ncbi:hypothetical protein BJ6T_87700 [Bradyrhizobium japonicum USDA 6]|nr:hypothetical protein BJ6T_87700 [Bradyrhizobium japonicum USDA 6]
MSSKVALVFGGARGIGAAIAVRLARDGFDIALTYVSRPDSAGEIVAAIENAGRKAVAIKADSADPAAIRAAVAETVDRLGGLMRSSSTRVFSASVPWSSSASKTSTSFSM